MAFDQYEKTKGRNSRFDENIDKPKDPMNRLVRSKRSVDYDTRDYLVGNSKRKSGGLQKKEPGLTGRHIPGNESNKQDTENAKNPNDAVRLASEYSALKGPMFEAFCHKLCNVQQAE
jgi:hypothetical protein